jgi:hypothetical protein
VENEARLRHQIRQALDPVVPDAPWVTSKVRKSLREQSTEPWRRLRGFAPIAGSGTRTAVAILLMLAIVAGFLVGSRALSRLHSAGPQTDPAVQKYRTVVDRNFSSVENLVLYGTPGTCNEARVDDCLQKVHTTRAAAQRFLDALDEVSVPPQLSAYDTQLKAGLAHVNVVLDGMRTALERKDFAAYAIGSGHLFDAKLDEVYPYVIAVDCWPKAAVHGQDAAGYDVIRCGATTSEQYFIVVGSDFESLRSSFNASSALCGTFGAQCRARTLESRGVAQQFSSDLNRTPVPIQYAGSEKELQQGLDRLILAYDERAAAIDAGDHARWDAANVTIAQIKFNIVEKAVAEMACWPKGVHIGDDTSTTAWPCAS